MSIPAFGRLTASTEPKALLLAFRVTGWEMFVCAKEHDGLIVTTSESQRAFVLVDSSAGVGIIYAMVFESLFEPNLYVAPILVSAYAIAAALPVLSETF